MRGKVYFVGAGTGSAELLTLRAARLLQCADVVLHDDLVAREVVDLTGAQTRVISVGKRAGRAGTSQAEINALMIEHARSGAAVVRLKCGDPSLFGRLGEEIDALRAARVEFEIVPGVTAAVSAAAAAQISLTDRRLSSSVIFAAATLADGKRQDWRRLAGPDATLVIYMPGRDYARLGAELIDAGISPDLPCAAISRAGAADEPAATGTVADLLELSCVPAPAVVIVGEVVRTSEARPFAVDALAHDFHKENAHV